MNCEKIQNRIDELIFDSSSISEKEILLHMESCPKCSNHYQAGLKSRHLIQEISDSEPVINRPDELTDSIMRSIAVEAHGNRTQSETIRLSARLLAAAVIALLLTLGIEQYIVLNKLRVLESQLGMAEPPAAFYKNALYKANLLHIGSMYNADDKLTGIGKIKTLFNLNRIKQLNFTLYDINRYMGKDEFEKTDSLISTIKKNDLKTKP